MRTVIGLIVAIMLGLYIGDHANSAVFEYLNNHYSFNETPVALISLGVNLFVLAFFCYLWHRIFKYQLNNKKFK